MTAGPGSPRLSPPAAAPRRCRAADPGEALKATLRPYQHVGVRWLIFLAGLGLGACLADDMGLGKTVQMLALLLELRRQRRRAARRACWSRRLRCSPIGRRRSTRFAPALKSSSRIRRSLPADDSRRRRQRTLEKSRSRDHQLRLDAAADWIGETRWRLVVLDEAQAIKNPDAKQTRAVKALQPQSARRADRHAGREQAGRPVVDLRLPQPRAARHAKAFAAFIKRLAATEPVSYGPLRKLVRPYILRRLKTDKTVIADLPDKTEVKAFCALSKKQAALYQAAVAELSERLEDVGGHPAARAGAGVLMRFKQICNHPSQWLGDGGWDGGDSGKFARLREIAEAIAAGRRRCSCSPSSAR